MQHFPLKDTKINNKKIQFNSCTIW